MTEALHQTIYETSDLMVSHIPSTIYDHSL